MTQESKNKRLRLTCSIRFPEVNDNCDFQPGKIPYYAFNSILSLTFSEMGCYLNVSFSVYFFYSAFIIIKIKIQADKKQQLKSLKQPRSSSYIPLRVSHKVHNSLMQAWTNTSSSFEYVSWKCLEMLLLVFLLINHL